MKISILTAFPDLINSYLGASVLGRGIAKGRLEVEVIDGLRRRQLQADR